MLFNISYIVCLWLAILWLLPKLGFVKSLGFSPFQIKILFSFKVLVGIGFMYFYQYYYNSRDTTDAFRFYDDANIIYSYFSSDPLSYFKIVFGLDMQSAEVLQITDQLNNWYKSHKNGVFNDNMTIIRFNALVRLISFDIYHIHTLAINFLGFLGLAAMVGSIKQVGVNSKICFLSILLFPGILFWSSGVMKESLLLFVVGFVIHFGLKAIHSFHWKNLCLFILFFLLGLMIKSYVVLATLTGLGLLLTFKLMKQKIKVILPIYFGLGSGLIILLDKLLGFHIPDRIYQKQHDFLNEVAIAKPGSAFEIFTLERSWISLIQNAPQAIFNSAFRPFIWEAHSIISLIASFEIVLLISITVIAFRFKKKLNRSQHQIIAMFSISAFIILLVIGWVTPVFGTLVRYKIPALLFILLLLNIIIDTNKIPLIRKWLS